jgi:hypothetical protein
VKLVKNTRIVRAHTTTRKGKKHNRLGLKFASAQPIVGEHKAHNEVRKMIATVSAVKNYFRKSACPPVTKENTKASAGKARRITECSHPRSKAESESAEKEEAQFVEAIGEKALNGAYKGDWLD